MVKTKTSSLPTLEELCVSDLSALLDVIFILSENMSVKQLAKDSNLSIPTIYKLWRGEWKRPQFLTIQKLAYAVGLDVSLVRGEIVINEASDVLFAN